MRRPALGNFAAMVGRSLAFDWQPVLVLARGYGLAHRRWLALGDFFPASAGSYQSSIRSIVL